MNKINHTEGFFNKVLPTGHRIPGRINSLREEYQIMKRLEGVIGISQRVSFETRNNLDYLQSLYIKGRQIDFYRSDPQQMIPLLIKLSDVVTRIHRKGVHHRDFKFDHVKVDGVRDVYLLDFDQAVIGDPDSKIDFFCFKNTTGKNKPDKPWIGLGYLIKNNLGFGLVMEEALKILKIIWRMGARSKANAPDHNICYYSWDLFGHHFAGERDWLARWDPIYSRLGDKIRGSRILELGCNLGMFSSYCAIHGAKECIGVDSFPDIVDAASLFAQTISANKATFLQMDLNDRLNYEQFGGVYDFIVILSVMYWLKNKQALFNFLARQKCVIYEGHEKASLGKGEIDGAPFLKLLGFKNIEIICKSERNRLIYLATR